MTPTEATLFMAGKPTQLRRYLSKRGIARGDVDDFIQQMFERLMRLAPETDIRDPLSYAYRVVRNLIHEAALYRRMHPQVLGITLRTLDELPMGARPASSHEAELEELIKIVERRLQRLSPKCRAVWRLHDIEEMTYEEIGELVGISDSMVKKYLHLARNSLVTPMLDSNEINKAWAFVQHARRDRVHAQAELNTAKFLYEQKLGTLEAFEAALAKYTAARRDEHVAAEILKEATLAEVQAA